MHYSDAAMGTSTRHFKAKYWFHALLFRGIHMVINNVWCIRKYYGVNDSVADIRRMVADELLDELEDESQFGLTPLNVRDKTSLNAVRLNGLPEHWPWPGSARGGGTKGRSKQRPCAACKKGKTAVYCKRCEVHLHLGPCYEKWHLSENL